VSYGVTGQNAAIAIADFNRDGAQDVAVTNPADGGIEVLLGRGDGSLLPGRSYQAAAGAIGIAAADLNRDGIPDLVVVNQETSAVSVFLGVGDGTFGPKRDSPAGFTPTAFTIGDFKHGWTARRRGGESSSPHRRRRVDVPAWARRRDIR